MHDSSPPHKRRRYSPHRWHEYADKASLQDAAVAAILDCASHSIRERGHFSIVLAGGETPRPIYERLRSAPTDWSLWHVYFRMNGACRLPRKN